MKQAVIALLTAAAATAHAHPRNHGHAHLHNRNPSPVADMVEVPGPTVLVYELNGNVISQEDVEEGIRNGTLVWANGAGLQEASSSSSAAPSTYAPPPPSSTSIYVAPTTSSESSTYTPPASTSTSEYVAPSSSSAPSAEASPDTNSNKWGGNGGSSSGGDDSSFDHDSSTGLDEDFPDGQVDCSTFPSDYGAIPVDWMNIGGWTGVQQPGSNSGGFGNIMTVTPQTCNDGKCCTEGSYCSYACPAGYQKSQWPETQGATGQSVGGLLCQNGKLHLTNSALSSKLCMTGTDAVVVQIQNKLSKNAAVCRTDYPGTEGETVPLNTQPGSYTNLTCPDADRYYKWGGGKTSAQYYVNPAGVSVQDACQWGSSDNPWGNFAPMNLGVGYTNGAAWLSIFQNLPTTSATLDFTVEIVGDAVSGTCKYSNGQYCGGANYDQCSSTTGCTVSASSGTVTFVFSDS